MGLVSVLSALCLTTLQGNATATSLPSASLTAPFSSFGANGMRNLRRWETSGSTRVAMGSVRLTQPQSDQAGAIWTKEASDVSGGSFSFDTRFRMSGFDATTAGESMTWYVVADAEAAVKAPEQGEDSFGGRKDFTGVAIVVAADHAEAMEGQAVKQQQQKIVSHPLHVLACRRTLIAFHSHTANIIIAAQSLRWCLHCHLKRR